jgi:hypothetical protein
MRREWFGFAVLCVVAGSVWLLDEAVPGPLSGLLRVAVHDGLLAVCLCVWGWLRAERAVRPSRMAMAAVVLFGVPQVVLAGAGGHVSQLTAALVAMLVPVVVVLVVAQRAVGFGVGQNPLGRMVPAALGVGGASLLLPFSWPPTALGQVWMGALVASAVGAGVAAVWLHDLVREQPLVPAAAVVAGATGAAAAAFCWVDWPSAFEGTAGGMAVEGLRLVAVDGPLLLLAVWLLGRLRPVAFSARALLVPLVTIAESFAMLRPSVGWEMVLGAVLMAAGGWGLLRGEDSAEML